MLTFRPRTLWEPFSPDFLPSSSLLSNIPDCPKEPSFPLWCSRPYSPISETNGESFVLENSGLVPLPQSRYKSSKAVFSRLTCWTFVRVTSWFRSIRFASSQFPGSAYAVPLVLGCCHWLINQLDQPHEFYPLLNRRLSANFPAEVFLVKRLKFCDHLFR